MKYYFITLLIGTSLFAVDATCLPGSGTDDPEDFQRSSIKTSEHLRPSLEISSYFTLTDMQEIDGHIKSYGSLLTPEGEYELDMGQSLSINDTDIVLTPKPSQKLVIDHATHLKNVPPSFSVQLKDGLWVYMEHVDQNKAKWWNQRIGWEAYTLFKPQVEIAVEYARSSLKERGWAPSSDKIPYQEGQSFFNQRDRDGELDPWFKTILPSLEGPRTGEYYCKRWDYNSDYIDAWNGFLNNLNNHEQDETWVAYVATKPIDYKAEPTTSPSIQMAMTVLLSDKIYAPLGIYKSPIAEEYNSLKGLQYKGISLDLHATVASFIEQLSPSVEYLALRPLESMLDILMKACENKGIRYSLSSGGQQYSIDEPHIKLKETDSFPEVDLIDPQKDQIIRFSWGHWFRQSKFLGNSSWQKRLDYRFFVARRKDVTKINEPLRKD